MKINGVHNSWQTITQGFSKLVKPKKRKIANRSLPSWSTSQKEPLSFLGEQLVVREVNLRHLLQFVDSVPKELSFKTLISSPLPLRDCEWQSAADITRMVALKNLLELVMEQIAERQFIEINQIARTKG